MAANTVLDGGRLGSVRGDLLNGGGFFFRRSERERIRGGGRENGVVQPASRGDAYSVSERFPT